MLERGLALVLRLTKLWGKVWKNGFGEIALIMKYFENSFSKRANPFVF